MTIPTLSFGGKDGAPYVPVDLGRLYESRLLIQGVSGSGKSTAIRALLEQTHGVLPQFVVDFDGDFVTLREKYDYVLVGPDGDVPISIKTAKITIRRLAELGVSAIFDISEMKFPDRREWVKQACEQLVHLPRSLWTSRLFVLDEAHIFAPERGFGESVSTSAVIDVITLGRKRGIVSVCATQRLSKFHKDAAAELLNKLIGYTDDVDLQRAGDQLGMTKEQRAELKRLETHTFYAYGPAISRAPVLVRTKMPATTPPARGEARPMAPPARASVKKVLAQLADLPKEAEAEARTLEDLRKQLNESERRIRQMEKGGTTRTIEKLVVDQAAVDRAVLLALAKQRKQLKPAIERVQRIVVSLVAADLPAAVGTIASLLNEEVTPNALRTTPDSRSQRDGSVTTADIPSAATGATRTGVKSGGAQHRSVAPGPRRSPSSPHGTALPKGEKVMLIAIAQYPDGATRDQLSVLTGYKRSSRDTYIQRLLTNGYVANAGGVVAATEEGIEALGDDFEPLPEGEQLQAYWLDRLPEGERKVLEVLVNAYPEVVRRDDLDDLTGYKRSSRDTYLQRLRSRKLVEDVGHGEVRASPNLFGGDRS